MRLLIHVEGQTEETFVDEVLAPHLIAKGFSSVGARLLGNARLRRNRGGIKSWPLVRTDLGRHILEDGNCISTLLVDYYGLPARGAGAWPGRAAPADYSAAQKAALLEKALLEDFDQNFPKLAYPKRFIPYVLMHEFEGLLFSDCVAFLNGIARPDLAPQMLAIRNAFISPEEINDSPHTAPSKRISMIVDNYEKPLFGALGALEIGLGTIRAECAIFNAWLTRLEMVVS